MAACGGGDPAAPVVSATVDGATTINAGGLEMALAGHPAPSPLSAAERDSLLHVRQEEQFAHDV